MPLDLGDDLDLARAISEAAHIFLGFCKPMLDAPMRLRYFHVRWDDGQTYTFNDGTMIIAPPGLGRGTLEELDTWISSRQPRADT